MLWDTFEYVPPMKNLKIVTEKTFQRIKQCQVLVYQTVLSVIIVCYVWFNIFLLCVVCVCVCVCPVFVSAFHVCLCVYVHRYVYVCGWIDG